MTTGNVALLSILVFLTACSSLKRSQPYEVHNAQLGSVYESPEQIKDRRESNYEFGYHRLSRPLTENEYQKLQTRIRLKQLERELISSREKNLYFKNKAFFRDDMERIEFLQIADFADRLRWMKNRSFESRLSNYSSSEQEAIEQNDILLYMSMNAVRESWGEPDNRLISGSEYRGNEKWVYHNYESTPDGYKKQNRTLFFENGRVIAWQTN